MKKLKIVFLTQCFIALLLGLIAYIVLKDNTYIHSFIRLFWNIPKIELGDSIWIDLMRRFLADALWAYAMTFALSIVEKKEIAFLITSGCGILWELLQLFGVVGGHFEVLDIIIYILASAIAILVINGFRSEKENGQP